ncbi:MAG: hypothetical protein V1827_00685 [Candidatus Micrarchaeota archaeon]
MQNARMLFSGALFLLLICPVSFAETTCTRNGCDITLTLKMAFSGANDSYINGAEKEIEDFWNGPSGYRLVGDCKCKMTVDVQTMKITDPAQINCNPGPPGYHCIMVTDYNNNPPRNQTQIAGAQYYRGYVYGIATGNGSNSQMGWWSNMMSAPIGGTTYSDMAHEAGHLMGLGHNNDNTSVMNNTAVKGPSQGDLDGAAKSICGDDYCPDSCCCGNGVVDKGKGEGCDPNAKPTGCAPGAAICCPVCCSCYTPICMSTNGEFDTLSSCQASCGPGSSCYKNYKSGCYDCLKQTAVTTKTCYDPSNIRGNPLCDHPVVTFSEQSLEIFRRAIPESFLLAAVLSDERINVQTAEGDVAYLVTEAGSVSDYGPSLLPDATMTIHTDRQTIAGIAGGRMTVRGALAAGKIRIQGEGPSAMRFGIMNLLIAFYDFISPPPEPVEAVMGQELPNGYREEMEEFCGTAQEPLPPEGYGEAPDSGYRGTRIEPW